MRERHTKVIATRFEPETRFEVRPEAAAPFRAVHENNLEVLKSRLLSAELRGAWEPEAHRLLRRAANEAASLAWVTPYPTLVFPALFEEKIETARAHATHQAQVRRASRELLVA